MKVYSINLGYKWTRMDTNGYKWIQMDMNVMSIANLSRLGRI
ncbi:MAG: hypothetical protein ABIN36_06155 [Ferruginibacter sp.]